jgi:SPP1 family predicted phage head-tail adaptor
MGRAGNRRHQVQVQQRVTGKDALGAPVHNWTTLFNTTVGITPLSGRELMAAQAIRAEATHNIEASYRAEWANPVRACGYRILFGERIFNIQHVQNVDERNREVLIIATEGLNDG